MSSQDIGLMEWHGLMGGSKSYHGYEIDILKSGIQKYLRRKTPDKMIFCVVELLLFSSLESTQALLTNLINRLIVSCCEEMCFVEWDKLLQIQNLIDEYEESKRQDHFLIIEVCYLLLNAKRIRLTSDIASVYNRGVKSGLSTHLIQIDRISNINVKKYLKPQDSEETIKYFKNFVKCLKDRNDEIFYWMFQIYHQSKNKVSGGLRFRRKTCDYIMWEYLFAKSSGNPNLTKTLNIYLTWYFKKDRNEQIIFLIAAILCVLHRNKINWNKSISTKNTFTQKDYLDLIIKHKRSKIEIDDFVIDMHTRKGRTAGKDKKDFYHEGSLVVDEDREYFNQEYRNIYKSIKMETPIQEPIEEKKEYKSPSLLKSQKRYDQNVKFISWETIKKEYLTLCDEGRVCSSKPVCIITKLDNLEVILKEVGKGTNYGLDCELFDRLKPFFDLKPHNLYRIKSDGKFVKDKTEKLFHKDQKIDDPITYIVMNRFHGKPLSVLQKSWYQNKNLRLQYFYILLIRGIFNVSDGNERNVLIDEDQILYSIDEMVIFKKDKKIIGIMNKGLRELCKNDINEGLLDNSFELIKNKFVEHHQEVKKVLKTYQYGNHYEEVKKRTEDLKEIILKELSF